MDWLWWMLFLLAIVAATAIGVALGAAAVFGGFLSAWFKGADKGNGK